MHWFNRGIKALAAGAVLSSLLFTSPVAAQDPQPGKPTDRAFVNPLLPGGPDPWITSRNGFYYYMATTGRNLQIWKTRSIADLATAEHVIVWSPPATGPYSRDIWAPELHFLRGHWYIYFAADGGDNVTHRLWVLENESADPTKGQWKFKGQITDSTNRWAIDATVFENKGHIYMLWSGWEGDKNGQQNIYIAELSNPWTVGSERVRISSPEFPWEQVGDLAKPGEVLAVPHVNVNEGPEVLQHGDSVFVTYSGSACWTDSYALGMLRASAESNLLDAASWHKSDRPVFWQSPEAHVYGTGHNSFFKSPDGKEDWILYHANDAPGEGCGNRRSPRAQPFTWNEDGTPNFGRPLPANSPINRPSGESH